MNRTGQLVLSTLLVGWAAGARADLVPSPIQFDFALHAVGSTSAPGATTLTNSGNQAVTVVSLTLVSQPSGVFAPAGGSCGAVPFTVAAQGSCTIAHTFSPNRVDTFYETLRATLSGGSYVEFGLRGEGEVAHLAISPPSLIFPDTRVGTTSLPITTSVTNDRLVPIQIAGYSTSNVPAASAFVRAGGTCPTPPFPLFFNQSCTLSYTFSPTQVGDSQVYLTIHGAESTGYFPVELSGVGLPEIPLFKNGFETPATLAIH